MSIKTLKQFIIFAREFDIELTADNLRKFKKVIE